MELRPKRINLILFGRNSIAYAMVQFTLSIDHNVPVPVAGMLAVPRTADFLVLSVLKNYTHTAQTQRVIENTVRQWNVCVETCETCGSLLCTTLLFVSELARPHASALPQKSTALASHSIHNIY